MKPAILIISIITLVLSACSSNSIEESVATPEIVESVEAATTDWQDVSFSLTPLGTYDKPIDLTISPTTDELIVLERAGKVYSKVELDEPDSKGNLVLDLTDKTSTDGERGILSATHSIDGELLYLHYTNKDGGNVISSFEIAGDSMEESMESEKILLEIEQPMTNHNGGQIHVDEDGLLYIGVGDGGGSGDPENNGQNPETKLGTILRIDVSEQDGEEPYLIPESNPFTDNENALEVFAYGLRNPWRFSFDKETGDLWIADVGQDKKEEIDFLPKEDFGEPNNFGWNIKEGNLDFEADDSVSEGSLIAPIHTYDRADGKCSVTGGYVYRGSAIPELTGSYLFGDFCYPNISVLTVTEDGNQVVGEIDLSGDLTNTVDFAQDSDGELYIVDHGGQVSLLVKS